MIDLIQIELWKGLKKDQINRFERFDGFHAFERICNYYYWHWLSAPEGGCCQPPRDDTREPRQGSRRTGLPE